MVLPDQTANRLSSLPFDILHTIISHIPDAASLSSLSRTCKALHTFASASGWQLFVQTQFPSIYATYVTLAPESVDWRQQARQLTTLSRNYDRRAFRAVVLDPDLTMPNPYYRRGGGRGRNAQHVRWGTVAPGRGRQSVGYHPVLAAAARGDGDVLAIGAGQDLVLRRRQGTKVGWWLYGDRSLAPGRDDITTLSLFPEQVGDAGRMLVGRANGALSVVWLLAAKEREGGAGVAKMEMSLETRGAQVRSASLREGLVASVLGYGVVAVHRLPEYQGQKVKVPIAGEVTLDSDVEVPWTTTFLSEDVLAVGKNSVEPVAVCRVTPTGLSVVRSFSAEDCVGSKVSSVNPIAPLPDIMGSPNLFLTGWYEGSTLLHDLRTPLSHTATFKDPLDPTSKIYSILPIGRERIVVGGGRHNLLKIFDIRMPNGRVYYPPHSVRLAHSVLPAPSSDPEITPGWATYLNHTLADNHGLLKQYAGRESPVYSLASAGVGGARVFAGVQGCVMEFDFLGGALGTERRGWPVSCTMYQFVGRPQLWRQRGPEGMMGSAGVMGPCGVLDGRWV